MRKVLICDDDTDLIEMTMLILSTEKVEMKSLSDMENFLKVVEEFNPDIVLLDLRMPKIDGTQAIQLLRSKKEMEHIPIILFSANTELENIARKFDVAYIKKPFNINELREKVLNTPI